MQVIEFLMDKSKVVSVFIVASLVLLIVFEKTTWQYYPLFFVGIFTLFIFLFNYLNPIQLTSQRSHWIVGIGVGLLIVSILAIIILPTMKLPTPSGEFSIGTQTFEVRDKTRKEIYTNDPNDYRRIKYQLWYPAQSTDNYKKALWIQGGKDITRSIAKSMNLPGFLLDHTSTILSNSYVDAPISEALDKYPVVVISHGWQGFRALHTDYAEELASHGYVVVSIDHTYGSQAVVFDDKDVAELNSEALPQGSKASIFDPAAKRLVSTYREDVRLVLDELETINASQVSFKGKLDLDALGLLGHSTGGGGDVYLALEDKRITSFMGLDAWVKPVGSDKLKQGLTIPSLFLRSEQWAIGPNNDALSVLFNNSTNYQLIQLNQTNHVDFAMTYMYSPFTKYIGFTGELGGRKSSEIQREFILAFFNKTLKTKTPATTDYLSEIVDKYDVVKFIDKVNN